MRWSLLFIPFLLSALDFKVATYNVENLFDATKNGSEYKEYQPYNKHGWTEAMLQIKINNLARVIGDINADIIVLAEVENRAVLQKLNAALGEKAYPYLFYPTKKERVSIETALLSRFPIEKSSTISLPNQARGIHRVSVTVDIKPLDLYINHWPAYIEKEDERLVYAKTLHTILEKASRREYILLGDFNSPYQEQKGHWGMGLVTFLQAGDQKALLYNLWYELPQNRRYSHSYGKQKNALDHIIIPKSLMDRKGIEYTPSSFGVFIRPYMLDENGNPNRWQISNKGRGEHQGFGFSDHFPITATFHTLKD
ncbi:endonuclease/exonuclease/phosphatase family protein [Sulfurospirillum multivorans]|uniref:Exonuclease-endonuclease-phosphatase (EEP) domain-containing protein n=2 Tax=Sulfurospirillum multivorans TaxID=66821 RepID=A0AA86DYM2_SULMK|nr:endonuclease/exonuclease/phosphatase family protein [Sulfurospirillum multivorans]AHJ13398.1 exonuclease-endonuclease-phosphatase (EEP) domain-containing protein [Sulfurospirillum multivorans DSM 12446]QEH06889.1 exonuclease-endonuclease-phosphatase (EEP) domain-containing protein [Sulfurospirillum multivorans]